MQTDTPVSGYERVHKHYNSVYRRALALTRDSDHASDLTQETFKRVLGTIHEGNHIMYPAKYLFTALRHLFFREVYGNKDCVLSSQDMDAFVTAHEPEQLNEPDRINSEDLWEEINRLDDKFREPVILFYFDELQYKDIAKHLSVPLGTVMSRISRARRYLKLRLNSVFYNI